MKKKLIGLVLTAVFAFTSLTGCGQAEEQRTSAAAAAPEESAETSSSVKEQEGITITDQAGRTVKLDGPAEKLVSSYYISTALLVALGCEDNLAGIEMKADTRALYRLAAPGLLDLPAVGSGKGINVEETAALEPDVVILPKRLEESVSSFDALGIPAVVVNPETQEDFEECLSLLAEITGRQKEGEELLDYYHGKMNFARELTKDADVYKRQAMERSPIKDIEIKHILKNALTDNINDREIYMKGIDHSYYYEGYFVFKTKDLTEI